ESLRFCGGEDVFNLLIGPALREGFDNPVPGCAREQILEVPGLRPGEPEPAPPPIFRRISRKPSDDLRQECLIGFRMFRPVPYPCEAGRVEGDHADIARL